MGCGQSSETSSPQLSAKTEEKNNVGKIPAVVQVETEKVADLNNTSSLNGSNNLLKVTTKNGNESAAPVGKSAVTHMHAPTHSQVDFFKMLDHKIENGPDYVSINEEKES